ncbi:MAG: 4'-phosphopantetheinyl transferase superfamily protein [Desulfobacula sp.]|jgi:4'-phosphopantetheinyl transferase
MTLSRLARECVTASAFKSSFDAEIFEKNASGVPRPSNGIFWSLSHKSGYVAGVVSKQSVGIDLEELKTISDAMFKRIVDQTEFSHFGHQDKTFIFFRVFTAKEAVLKKTGEGMKGLSNIKIDTVSDDNNLIVQYRDKKYRIENIYFDGYLASVTKDNLDVEWSFK